MDKIKIAIVGVGNCASSLVQEINYYRDKEYGAGNSYIYWKIGGYKRGDIEVVAAFDIDKRKVGKDVNEAILSKPDHKTPFYKNILNTGVPVQMGKILDGYSDYIKDNDGKEAILLANYTEPTRDVVVNILQESGAEVILNYLPANAEKASKFYAYCALCAGVAFINNTTVLIASNPIWASKFEYKNVPLIGDDLKTVFSVSGFYTSSIISILCSKSALVRSQGGVLLAPSAYFCKHTLRRFTDDEAYNMIVDFIKDGDSYLKEIPSYHSRNRKLAIKK